ncbi:hypothetical protein FE391_06140 [Nonomuraea sp. KC401]|uniref:hypothetical protein n=1 Tax=unclassified Nonomuraea TaxID=2593643 RepID=UPI0010FD127F|nr:MULTISPECIES: hypothetical protein [unclassified Nonomuraea]NBE92325.1 hypothetical protein [Nonomuraea sp. K271]TLF81869.1 hypothetical protein FE391_06140 [Nonomuraea sp. KC401]
MSVVGFQELLARILRDPDLLTQLHDDPAGFIERQRGDPEAVRMLTEVDADRIRLTSWATAQTQRTLAWRVLPAAEALCRQLGTEHRHVRDAGVLHAQEPAELARRLFDLADRLDGIEAQLIAFDLLLARAVSTAPSSVGLVRLRSSAMIATFGYPVAKARQLLLSRQDYRLSPETSHYVLYETPTAYGSTRISGPIRDVLVAYDEGWGTEAVADRLRFPVEAVARLLRQADEHGFTTCPSGRPDSSTG